MMKKVSGKKALIGGILTTVLSFAAFAAFATSPAPKVEINGVTVYSPISYSTKDDKTMVDVDSFFTVMEAPYQYSSKNSTISYKDETVSVKRHRDGLVADLDDLANIIDATHTKTNDDGSKYVLVLPEGTIKLTESYVNMGEHWANPAEDILFYGPNESPVFKTIYGVYENELIFFEQMIAQEYMEGVNAQNWLNFPGMKGLPSPAVVQTDVEFNPNGHANYEVPHYDFHHYFISDEEQHNIKGQPLHGEH